MKKFTVLLLLFSFCAVLFAANRKFIEGTDYFVDFQQNDENRAAVLHINFISIMPAPAEAEAVLKDQLKVFGKILEAEKEAAKKEEAEKDKTKSKDKAKAKPKEKSKDKSKKSADPLSILEEEEEEKFKNIVGSVWYTADGDPENSAKINYSDDSSAFVWIGKTKKIVLFPEYIKFLKKEKEEKKEKDKAKALALKQLEEDALQESGEEMPE